MPMIPLLTTKFNNCQSPLHRIPLCITPPSSAVVHPHGTFPYHMMRQLHAWPSVFPFSVVRENLVTVLPKHSSFIFQVTIIFLLSNSSSTVHSLIISLLINAQYSIVKCNSDLAESLYNVGSYTELNCDFGTSAHQISWKMGDITYPGQ